MFHERRGERGWGEYGRLVGAEPFEVGRAKNSARRGSCLVYNLSAPVLSRDPGHPIGIGFSRTYCSIHENGSATNARNGSKPARSCPGRNLNQGAPSFSPYRSASARPYRQSRLTNHFSPITNHQSPLTLGRNAQIFDLPRLRDHGRKLKVVPGIFVDDHRGFTFDLHLFGRYPASAFEGRKNHFADFV
jgi:hypothetical protein